MTDFGSGPAPTMDHLSVEDDGSADTGTKHDPKAIALPGRCAEPLLANEESVDVVFHLDRHAKGLFQTFA